jgi:hypothetical protein
MIMKIRTVLVISGWKKFCIAFGIISILTCLPVVEACSTGYCYMSSFIYGDHRMKTDTIPYTVPVLRMLPKVVATFYD